MYKRLTKLTIDDTGRECVTCANFGTERCRLHSKDSDCSHCPVMGAILNQLYHFEEIVCADQEEGDSHSGV